MFTVTNALDSGDGSLRAAILSANATTGSSTIDFDIPGTGVQTIALLTPLPATINPVVIDGTTQPGYQNTPLIELEGASILDNTKSPPSPIPNVNGLVLSGGNSLVRGLDIDRFSGSGIFVNRDGNTITGDFIGTDPTGTMALGNGVNGVVFAGRNNFLGADLMDPPPGFNVKNVISGNGGAGVFLGSSGSALPSNDVVEGNLIGTDVGGTSDLGNAGPGIDVESSNNSIGLTSGMITPQNTIAFNGGAGVQVGSSPYVTNVIQNRIAGNGIFDNVSLGIDLGNDGVTPNAPGGSNGPNERQVFPTLTSAYYVPQVPMTESFGVQVEGTLVASPNSTYTVEFFSNVHADRSGYGQGLLSIGSRTFTTNASGFADITSTLSALTAPGEVITATATDSAGNTSEFSNAITEAQRRRSASR